jgi:hypothetical protein
MQMDGEMENALGSKAERLKAVLRVGGLKTLFTGRPDCLIPESGEQDLGLFPQSPLHDLVDYPGLYQALIESQNAGHITETPKAPLAPLAPRAAAQDLKDSDSDARLPNQGRKRS